jgi:hypothetical protein
LLTAAIGEGNVAMLKADTEFSNPIGTCAAAVINRDFKLTINSAGMPANYSGSISGSGKVDFDASRHDSRHQDAPLVLDGKAPNTMQGTWTITSGQVALAKEAGTDALAGAIVVGGSGAPAGLVWNASHQINDAASLQLVASDKGVAALNLNGCSDTIGELVLNGASRVLTDGPHGRGVLRARKLISDGKVQPGGVYDSSAGWLHGSGYLLVGEAHPVDVSGTIANLNKAIGTGNIATLIGATVFKLPKGDSTMAVNSGDFPLTLSATESNARYSGFITGSGSVRIEAGGQSGRTHFEFEGTSSNAYKGPTTLARGVLTLNKPASSIAIPGNLTLGGSAAENKGDGVVWEGDGQIASSAIVTLEGDQPSFLDLRGHQVTFTRLVLSPAGKVRTGSGGKLSLKQLVIAGKRMSDGVYTAPEAWLEGSGSVTVDARVDAQGVYGAPDVEIGRGNIANLTGNTKFAYPASAIDLDIITNDFTIAFDSGDGNAFSCSGSISGAGNVEFFMGPSYTGFRDAPLRLTGERPNTTTGKFFVRKGRVQLEKSAGVDAISGDVIVGGQGFNDCLFWTNSDQLRDTVNITLVDAGNNGAAYLDLNGKSETAASLTMTVHNKIKTDSADGKSGVLIVKSLTIAGVTKPFGTYTAATEKWIEGKGQVVVRP